MKQIVAQPRVGAEQLQRMAKDKALAIGEAVRGPGYAASPFGDGHQAKACTLGLAGGGAS